MPYRPRIPKIYYPAGLISLIFLPLLCLWHLQDQKAFEELRMISVWWWSPDMYGAESAPFYPENHPDIHYQEIRLSGNETADRLALESSRLSIRQLATSGDTLNGVHFHFDAQAKYWTLIKAFEICKTEKARIFIPDDNDLWVYNLPPAKPSVADTFPIMGCCVVYSCGNSYQQSDADITNARNEAILGMFTNIQTYGVSILLFTGLVFLTFWKHTPKKERF
jgi:hypothetical protein